MRNALIVICFWSVCAPLAPISAADGVTEAGLTLLEAPSARPAALGEAYTAAFDDVTASAYNPALLGSLQSNQASFLFQRGVADDSYAHLMGGFKTRSGAWGLSLGHYDGGDVALSDGFTERSVAAQKDLALGVGWAKPVGRMSWGLTGKYFSSELAETYKATAMALDAGLSWAPRPAVRFGAAIQNVGSQLTYADAGEDLPRMMRAGAAFLLFPGKFKSELFVDVPYSLVRNEWEPGLGWETILGPVALRMGYKSGRDLEQFSVGTGFSLNNARLDYAFGMVDELDSRHRISLSLRFAQGPRAVTAEPPSPPPVPRAPPRKTLGAAETPERKNVSTVYHVKKGDTLPGISLKVYGDKNLWRQIYNANKHLLDDPNKLDVDQRLVIPRTK